MSTGSHILKILTFLVAHQAHTHGLGSLRVVVTSHELLFHSTILMKVEYFLGQASLYCAPKVVPATENKIGYRS